MKQRLLSLATMAAVLFGFALSAQAQSMEEKRDKKLGQGWVKDNPWIIMDFEKAKAKSKESGKPIFGYFTRSYSP